MSLKLNIFCISGELLRCCKFLVPDFNLLKVVVTNGAHSAGLVFFFLNACLSLLIRSVYIGKLTMKY